MLCIETSRKAEGIEPSRMRASDHLAAFKI
jgi:hypothetical protein